MVALALNASSHRSRNHNHSHSSSSSSYPSEATAKTTSVSISTTTTTTSYPSSSSYDEKTSKKTSETLSRVWIKQTAIEDALKRQKQIINKGNKTIRPSDGSVTSSNSSSEATPTARNTGKSIITTKSLSSSNVVPSLTNSSGHSSITSIGSSSHHDKTTPYGGRSFVGNSNGKSNNNNNIKATSVILPAGLLTSCNSSGTTQETETSSFCTDVSNQSFRQSLAWGWKRGYLVENSGGYVHVRLSSSASDTDAACLRLPADALTVGDVVLSNDYDVNPESGLLQVPNDLITLTHLHEPAVVESLQHRFAADQIYTSTGPVLLAMNPFQTVRGLYGEAVQKKYWERAERNLKLDLPPHVYAIADDSFRCMVRAIEDITNGSVKTANQSILVSGESGAGKTVTTKFVMKYLAALSHRSTVLQKSNEQRAYLKANESNNNNKTSGNHATTTNNNYTTSPTTNKAKGGWASAYGGCHGMEISANKTKAPLLASRAKNNNIRSSVTSTATDMTSVNSILSVTGCDSNSSSIEAQVLQSNPILESFGNARTVRNDNSSRFGKFIEIQFTQGGKLVGAQIETYLLEKVRLVTQTPGERNYHIFYELLSGAIDIRELSQYFLAHTAVPEDFRITACSGTFDRRDGVSDRETYGMLRQAMKTMNFSAESIVSVLKVTAAILHASNLTFVDIPGTDEEECKLDGSSVHLDPVCLMLGVSFEALNQALCTFNIQAGKSTVITRSFNKTKAATGLEALLKETYGALFNYLVRCINASIAFRDDRDSINDENKNDGGNGDGITISNVSSRFNHRPAATIGVLDIFGFESFTVNSFEQLCINYCNEALQQQFNAFVLRNEQAEYEAEGIEWSFIEFPENQEAIDLIDGSTGILRILDDQCRAPGPSDRSFAVNVYQHCSSSGRFVATRKQQAVLKFSVLHYAGPVEYTTDGFTEKNKDELPKESRELLLQSEIPFVRELAKIMSEQSDVSSATSSNVSTPIAKRLHRCDSTVGRPTVGGQFRTQLKSLRNKIDVTSPHYIRCLKPNDNLVPEHFDTAIVAEQLRCGGILEAVRVARAGFTQHYPHADFVRRYRALAWRELSISSNISSSSTGAWSGAAPRTPVGTAIGHTRNFRNTSKRHSTGSYGSAASFLPSAKSNNNSKFKLGVKLANKTPPKEEMTSVEAKAICKDLIKVLYRKIQQQEQDDSDAAAWNDRGVGSESSDPIVQKSPVSACATQFSSKSYAAPSWSIKSPASTKSPSAVLKTKVFTIPSVTVVSPSNQLPPSGGASVSRFSSWNTKSETKATTNTNIQPAWKKRAGPLSSSDYRKVGIQLGKTKVFLRHKAFEALERIRSVEQNKAATKLNATFRRYLSRIAYIPYRDAFRQELKDRMRNIADTNIYMDEQEDFGGSPGFRSRAYGSLDGYSCNSSVGSANPIFGRSCYHACSLVDKWAESQIRDAIRNPVPRHKWGKEAPSHEHNFKWMISDDGLWIKNYNVLAATTNDGNMN